MAKMPKYLDVEWDTKPTDFDNKGCDGLFIRSIKIHWWGWPILLLKKYAKFTS